LDCGIDWLAAPWKLQRLPGVKKMLDETIPVALTGNLGRTLRV
jgi:hypothetical protein